MGGPVGEKPDEAQEAVETILPEALPDFANTLEVPHAAIRNGKVTYGFLRIDPDAFQTIQGLSIWGKEPTPQDYARFKQRGIFVHPGNIHIGELYQGRGIRNIPLVPVEIRYDDVRNSYNVSRAISLDLYEQEQQQAVAAQRLATQQQAEDAATEAARELRLVPIVAALAVDPRFENLKERFHEFALMGDGLNYVEDNEGTKREATETDKLEAAIEYAMRALKKDEFDKNREALEAQATQIAETIGGQVDTRFIGQILVYMCAPEDAFETWEDAYYKALRIDKWLISIGKGQVHPSEIGRTSSGYLEEVDYITYVGQFTGATIQAGGAPSGIIFDTLLEPNKPIEKEVVWRVADNGEPLDNTADAPQIKLKLLSQGAPVLKMLEDAQQLERIILEEESRKEAEKAEAVAYINQMISKMPIATVNNGETRDTEWLGFHAIASAQYEIFNEGGLGKALVQTYMVELPGWGKLDLAKPARWPENITEAAEIIKSAWQAQQPEGAVVEGETTQEATWRLQEFIYNPSKLPEIPGLYWDTGYQRAFAYSAKDAPVTELPDIPGEWDQREVKYYTHDLALTGKRLTEPEYMGSIVLSRSRGRGSEGEFFAEVAEQPHSKLQSFLKDHPEVDPRLLKFKWVAVEPTE